jgi:hypothetical protein
LILGRDRTKRMNLRILMAKTVAVILHHIISLEISVAFLNRIKFNLTRCPLQVNRIFRINAISICISQNHIPFFTQGQRTFMEIVS